MMRGMPKNRLLALPPLLLSALLLALPARAQDARPEVSWDEIEDWALGEAVTVSPTPDKEGNPEKAGDPAGMALDSKKPANSTEAHLSEAAKTSEAAKPPEKAKAQPAIPAPKSKLRRPDPREYTDLRQKILHYAAQRLPDLEASRAWDKAFNLAFKAEQFPKAMDYLMRMAQDKRFKILDTEVWVAGKFCELGMSPGKASSQALDKQINHWKELANRAIEEAGPEKKFKRWDTPRDAEAIASLETLYRSWGPKLSDEYSNMELAGEDDPKYLWELVRHYSDQKRPFRPMSCLRVLFKLHEWHPEFAQVASGEVQARIAKLLWEAFAMPNEAIAAAQLTSKNFEKQGAVKNGDMCWIIAEANRELASEQNTNAERMVFLNEALKFYGQYLQNKDGRHNRRYGFNPFSECQRRLEDVKRDIATYQTRKR